jgi:hypothetical protein
MGWVASSETMRETHTQTQEAGTVVRGRNSGRWGRSSGCGGGASLADGTCGQSPMSNAARDDSHTHTLSHTLTHTQCTRITELTACSTGEGKGGAYQVGAYEVGWRLVGGWSRWGWSGWEYRLRSCFFWSSLNTRCAGTAHMSHKHMLTLPLHTQTHYNPEHRRTHVNPKHRLP